MYEELIKRLRRCSYSAPNGCGECRNCPNAGNFYECKQKLALQAADAIEELICKYAKERNAAVELTGELASKPRWIPVTEQPPLKVGDNGYNGYLVYVNGHYEIADYTTDKFDNAPYFHADGEYEPDVTHYMPLPQPPKEE